MSTKIRDYKYWQSRVNKLILGQSITIPHYATVTYYAKHPNGSRRFKITNVVKNGIPAGGNLPYAIIKEDIRIAA